MHRIKLIGLAILTVLAVSAVASATASAASPEFVPGAAGTTFTGESGSGTLTASGGSITCTKDLLLNGKLTTAKNLATVEIHFTGCTAFGIFGAHSLGDSEGTILLTLDLLLCYISKDDKEGKEGVHIEVAGKLIVVKGDQVGQITPVNTKTGKFTIVYKNPPVQCEGKTEHFLAEENETGGFKEAFEATTETSTFGIEQTLGA
jgi:hypothetical protein